MKQDKNLRDIELQTEFILAHIRRIRKSEKKLHPLDRDMLLNKTRDIYEKLLDTVENKATETTEKTINLPETMPEAEIPKEAESTKNISKGELIVEKPPVETKPEDSAEEQPLSVTREEALEHIEEKQEIFEEAKTFTEPEEPRTPEEKTEREEPEGPPSIDLFSTAEETVAEKLGHKEKSTVADEISRNTMSDLRQVIGINEKFLFINELFNGDMARYNKVIDDLNGMQNSEGARRYLIELKIASQWPDDMEAFGKLKELVERKFA
ncbi:MAG: hypothetical protein GXO86_09510 [Chlorobi bacterium]|nr:hypothetical protein [Chlorobiota bacterium]